MRDDFRHDERRDELTAQAAAIAPARHTPRLSPDGLTSLVMLAMREPKNHDPRTSGTQARSRHRVGYASAGAFLVACALVVAAVLGLQASTPSRPMPSRPMPSRPALGLPVLKVRGTPTNGGYGGLESQVTYKFLADPNLSKATGSASAYVLASPADMAAATGTIAKALGLSDTVTYLGPGNYNGGPSSGPDVTVDTQSGVLNWLYPTWSGNVNTTPSLANPTPIAVNPNAPLPTDGQATMDAEQLLQAAGVGVEQLGAPKVSRYEAGVNVAFQVVAGGIPTDQEIQVEYGPGATVLTASGIIATTTLSATYPSISPTDAVGLLTDGSGGGEASQPIVTVDISQATMTLATYVLTDGTSCLLPTWALSGPENGSGVAAGSTYTGSVLAVPAQYVQLAQAT
jgi:hypothetical protein